MLKTFKAFEAPSRYDFVDPDTHHEFLNRNKHDLMQDIIAYRAQNNLPHLEYLSSVLDNYWCEQLVNVGKCQECDPPPGFLTYLQGGITLIKAMLLKRFASLPIAEARAAVCVKCPYNSFPDRGPFLAWIEDIAVACVGEKKVSVKEKLGVCAICSCPLRSKVFIDEELPPFTPLQIEKMEAVKCWQPALTRKK